MIGKISLSNPNANKIHGELKPNKSISINFRGSEEACCPSSQCCKAPDSFGTSVLKTSLAAVAGGLGLNWVYTKALGAKPNDEYLVKNIGRNSQRREQLLENLTKDIKNLSEYKILNVENDFNKVTFVLDDIRKTIGHSQNVIKTVDEIRSIAPKEFDQKIMSQFFKGNERDNLLELMKKAAEAADERTKYSINHLCEFYFGYKDKSNLRNDYYVEQIFSPEGALGRLHAKATETLENLTVKEDRTAIETADLPRRTKILFKSYVGGLTQQIDSSFDAINNLATVKIFKNDGKEMITDPVKFSQLAETKKNALIERLAKLNNQELVTLKEIIKKETFSSKKALLAGAAISAAAYELHMLRKDTQN